LASSSCLSAMKSWFPPRRPANGAAVTDGFTLRRTSEDSDVSNATDGELLNNGVDFSILAWDMTVKTRQTRASYMKIWRTSCRYLPRLPR
jgi:hypothetical protein